MSESTQTAVLSVLIENEAGALGRVVGLFSARGYNVESLTVAVVEPESGLSRITIVTSGTAMVIEQIKAQLNRLIPVHGVTDLTACGPHVAREMALIKVVSRGDNRTEGMRIADAFRARIVDTTAGSFVFELTGAPEKIDAFVDLMRPLGMAEVSRTGVAAIMRGPQTFKSKQECY